MSNDLNGNISRNEEFAGAIRAGFIAEIGNSIPPIETYDIEELKRQYASIIIQLDRIRPALIAADVQYRQNESSWSIKEILGHLIDADREIWWPRIEAALIQEHPQFAIIDQKELVKKNRWQSLPLEDILAQLMRIRWNFAMRLNTMPAESFERTGEHLALGDLSVLRIIQMLVAHDAHYMDLVRDLIAETSK